MIMFRPLLRYADFKGRASRSEYWLFAVLQGLFYGFLLVLGTASMGQGDSGQASTGVMVAFSLIVLTVIALIVPNYAVLVRRLHDSDRGAIWLCLMIPSVVSTVLMVGTIGTAVGSVGLGASREAFVATMLAGIGAAGLMSVVGMVCQLVLFVLMLLPGTRGENRFGPDPRDPSARFSGGGEASNSTYDDARLEALFAEAKRANGAEQPYRPVFDFGPGPAEPAPAPRPPVDWGQLPPSTGVSPAPVFGRRGA